jgi:BirA family transcriptional regulator, biotin operon repressor / biotin---[acetyl-CoA-carboxylase] ligase
MDSLAADAVEPLLEGRFGRPYLYSDACASTQELLDVSLAEGAVALCDEQTAGKGRLGRRWEAPAGTALLCSILLRPPRERKVAQLSLVGGLATAAAVEGAVGFAAQIKWPNDVIVSGAKVAGVLAEARDGAVVLGIGVNVNQERGQLPEGAGVPAASLRTVDGRPRERAPILASLLVGLERYYDRWLDRGIDGIHVELGSRDFLRGRRVSVDDAHGVAVGIDDRGRLQIDLEGGGRRLVESGEVTYEQ